VAAEVRVSGLPIRIRSPPAYGAARRPEARAIATTEGRTAPEGEAGRAGLIDVRLRKKLLF